MEIMDQFAAVLVVFLLLGAVLLAVLLKTGKFHPASLFPKRQARLLALEDRLVLGPQHQIHIVRIDGQRFVVATHPSGVTFAPHEQAFTDHLNQATSNLRHQL